jgi:predicted transcriptional regulator
MATVTLSDDLRERLERNAPTCGRSIDTLVGEAVKRYVRQLEQEKIDREMSAYTALHADLRHTHFGRWVAIHNGELVDCDDEPSELERRIRSRFGPTAVLITEVRETPEREIWLRPMKPTGH